MITSIFIFFFTFFQQGFWIFQMKMIEYFKGLQKYLKLNALAFFNVLINWLANKSK